MPPDREAANRGGRALQGGFMRKTIMAAMAAVSLIAVSGCNKQPAAGGNDSTQVAAAGDINGTWKADIDSIQFDTKPDEMLLQGGTFPANPARLPTRWPPTAPSIKSVFPMRTAMR